MAKKKLRPATAEEIAEFEAEQAAPAEPRMREATPEEIAEHEASLAPKETPAPVPTAAPAREPVVGSAKLSMARAAEPVTVDSLKAAYSPLSNVLTLGMANRLRDREGSDSSYTAAERARLAEENPKQDALGTGTGYLFSALAGPGRVLDAAARAGVSKAAPGLAGSAVGRTVADAAAGAASGAAQGEAIGGDGVESGAAGGLWSGLLRGGSEVSRGLSRLLGRDPAIAGFRAAKGDGRMARVEAGAAAGEVTPDPAGQFKQAAATRDRIWARDEAMAADEAAKYRAAVEPEMQKPAGKQAIQQKLLDVSLQNRIPSTGEPIDVGLMEEMANLTQKLGREPTVEDVLALRHSYREASDFGSPAPTDKQKGARKVYQALRAGVREGSPAVGAADDAFANAQRARARRNDLMLGNEDGPRSVQLADDAVETAAPARQAARAGDEERAAVMLSRLGDESVEGARKAGRLQELAAQDPEFAAALDDLAAYKSWVATRFGTPDLPTNLSQAVMWPLRIGKQNARALGARVVDPALETADTVAAGASGAATVSPMLLDLGRAARREAKERRNR